MTKTIWFREVASEALLQQLNLRSEGCMVDHVGIRFTEITADSLAGTMPVDKRTKQPYGLLHGGASVVLAETLASSATNLTVDPEKFYAVGLEINANHVKSATEGLVTGVTRPLHRGRRTQVWETRITQGEDLICVSRMTLAIISRQK